MVEMFTKFLALILGLSFIAFVIVGLPAQLYGFYLWIQLQRELIEPKPFGFTDAHLIWNPVPERYTLKGRALVPVYFKWQRIGIVCLVGAAITGPLVMWFGRSGA